MGWFKGSLNFTKGNGPLGDLGCPLFCAKLSFLAPGARPIREARPHSGSPVPRAAWLKERQRGEEGESGTRQVGGLALKPWFL